MSVALSASFTKSCMGGLRDAKARILGSFSMERMEGVGMLLL